MTALALRLILGAASGFAPPPVPSISRADLHALYVECLEEHDIEADENDGECEEP
jgi:hypothetical protein